MRLGKSLDRRMGPSMPESFNKLGISFQYPENWTLDEADAEAGRDSVTVYSPGGGFWSVAAHPGSADPVDLVNGVVDVMKAEYSTLEVEEVRETLVGHELIGCDMNFYFLDFLNWAQVRSVRVPGRTYTIFCQGEDTEFDRLREVFRAMTASLLR